MTPIVDVRRRPTIRRRGLMADRLEIWSARSADGRWLYHRDDSPGTPWVATYVPTGQQESFTSLATARRWTASGAAVSFLRQRAADVVARGGQESGFSWPRDPQREAQRAADRLGRAQQILDILDGRRPPLTVEECVAVATAVAGG